MTTPPIDRKSVEALAEEIISYAEELNETEYHHTDVPARIKGAADTLLALLDRAEKAEAKAWSQRGDLTHAPDGKTWREMVYDYAARLAAAEDRAEKAEKERVDAPPRPANVEG